MATKKKAPKRGSLKLKSAGVSLTVGDLDKSVAWYRDVLGCTAGDEWNEGGFRGAEMNAGDVSIMLNQDDWKKGRDRVKGEGMRVFCNTKQDIDKIAARIKAAGGTLEREPKDEWGMRAFSLADPDGFKITIAAKSKKKKS
jgi:catechol 2,3-dioxygenase-like lactoylglutathione lyase family enzyme